MLPLDGEETNYVVKVHERLSKDCVPLRGKRGMDKKGNPYIIIRFQPNMEDIEAIIDGQPVSVIIYAGEFKNDIEVFTGTSFRHELK